MSRMRLVVLAALATVALCPPASADEAIARLRAFEEVPALSSPGGGFFDADIAEDGQSIEFALTYFHLRGTVTQAHLHFAQRGVNGGIMLFLCSNLGNGPAGTQQCPPDGTADSPAIVFGTLDADDIVASAAAQGIAPLELHEVLRAMRAGAVYANVHSDIFPGGEIRGQLKFIRSEAEPVELDEP